MKIKKTKDEISFVCPTDGRISQEDVAFLCNTCGGDKVTVKEGLFLCPQCLTEGENFQCMICDSKQVKVLIKGKESNHL